MKRPNPVILFVEDEEALHTVAGMMLAGTGIEITWARGRREALELMGGGAFDLIMLDLSLEDSEGFELYEDIRKIAGSEKIPIIFQTGMGFVDFPYKDENVSFLYKPYDRKAMLDSINKALALA